jgi:hypothetical protein
LNELNILKEKKILETINILRRREKKKKKKKKFFFKKTLTSQELKKKILRPLTRPERKIKTSDEETTRPLTRQGRDL